MRTAVISYVPAPHRGYVELFRAYAGAVLYVLGHEFIKNFAPLHRHLPGNDPEDAAAMVRALGIFSDVRILTPANVQEVIANFSYIVMPDEDVSTFLAQSCFGGCDIKLDGRWRLRWHKDAALQGRRPEGEEVITAEVWAQELMRKASALADRTPDWWRQVGAMLIRDGEVLVGSYNRHYPTEHTAYILGDPRSNFEAGQHIDMTVAGHGEVGAITTAARNGMCTEGCDMFVTTFPCAPCAFAIGNAGIQRLYYAEGYSQIHGADTLRSFGTEIIRVQLPPPS